MTEGDTPRLLFAWEKAHRFRWALFGFVLLSLIAHAASFFLFQIAYPERVTIPPPAPEVSLLLPTTAENRSALRRIEAEDPALVASATSITPPGLMKGKFRPSYEVVRTQPRTVAEEPVTVQFPPPKEPLAIIRSDSPGRVLASVAPPPRRTAVTFSTSLQARTSRAEPLWNFDRRASAPLDLATFLLGVTDRGEVRYVFLQHSSGDAALDQQAAAKLPTLKFEHDQNPITWGTATVAWGDDAYIQPKPPRNGRKPE